MGVKTKLDYLKETKNILKDAINETGGAVEEETLFKEYPKHIQTIIDTKIIPQSDLNDCLKKLIKINHRYVEIQVEQGG